MRSKLDKIWAFKTNQIWLQAHKTKQTSMGLHIGIWNNILCIYSLIRKYISKVIKHIQTVTYQTNYKKMKDRVKYPILITRKSFKQLLLPYFTYWSLVYQKLLKSDRPRFPVFFFFLLFFSAHIWISWLINQDHQLPTCSILILCNNSLAVFTSIPLLIIFLPQLHKDLPR